MLSRQSASRWQLPNPVYPIGEVCFTIRVPNEIHYIGAFYGAMYQLTYSKSWQNDPDHTAAKVARVWQRIFDSMVKSDCGPTRIPGGGIWEDFELPIRVDCDCNVFVTCCDGTEKQLPTLDQIMALIGQSGSGSPQPNPGGGCQTYHALLQGNGQWLLPTIVSSGDTLSVGSAFGATNDGGSIYWYCPDGEQFFGGACVGFPILDGADPLPTVNHLKLIALIGGTPYDVYGSLFTVPGGISNQPVTFQVNDDDLADNSGSISFDVIVCNNQAGTFRRVFDFTLTSGGATNDAIGVNAGVWTPSVGWKPSVGVLGGIDYNAIGIKLTFASTVITSITVPYDYTLGEIPGMGIYANNLGDQAGALDTQNQPATGNGSHTFNFAGSTAMTAIGVIIVAASHTGGTPSPLGDCTVASMIVEGIGADPF